MKNKNIQMKREVWEYLREYQKCLIKERYLESLSIEERRAFEKQKIIKKLKSIIERNWFEIIWFKLF